jgi:hypothetical protein
MFCRCEQLQPHKTNSLYLLTYICWNDANEQPSHQYGGTIEQGRLPRRVGYPFAINHLEALSSRNCMACCYFEQKALQCEALAMIKGDGIHNGVAAKPLVNSAFLV